jgi:extracellular elastinolytic metalloproteinase
LGFTTKCLESNHGYQTFGAGLDLPAAFAEATPEDQIISFVASQLNIDKANVAYKSGVDSEEQKVGYLRQTYVSLSFHGQRSRVDI